MRSWENKILENIDKADDLHIAPYRDDQKTVGTPTWIWAVVVDGELYVRAYNGQYSRWYQAAVKQTKGRIIAAGATYDVTFETVNDEALNLKIDAAYEQKYNDSPYLAHMVQKPVKSATIKISKAI